MALARALVNEPKVLLLDEPLGALDLKLREQMQVELKTLQRKLGITFVFVTHDQGEALSMADRVAIFNDGRIVQVGAPEDIYERPRTRFVADFVGSSNVLPPGFRQGSGRPGRWTSLRPEKIAYRTPARCRRRPQSVKAKVVSVHYQGAVDARRDIDAGGQHAHRSHAPSAPARFALGEIVTLPGRPTPCTPWRTKREQRAGIAAPRRAACCAGSPIFCSAGRSCSCALLLAPPLLWLGIVYLGSLFALLPQSFFSIDEFSGLINYEFTLADLCASCSALPISTSSSAAWSMAAAVTLAAAVIAFPIAYYAARYARGKWKALFYLAVMLPLWSSYLVKVYAWKLILAKEGIITWLANELHLDLAARRDSCASGHRRAIAVDQLSSAPSWSSSMSGCPS